jgi:signal transduction histidine kinase
MTEGPRDLEFFELLYRIGDSIHQSDEPRAVLQLILDAVIQYFRADAGSICLFNPNTNKLDIEALSGLPEECRTWELPMGVGLTGWVALHHQQACVDSVHDDPRYVKVVDTLNSAVAIPLVNQSFPLGVISIESSKPGFFDDASTRLLETVGEQIVKITALIWKKLNLQKKCKQLESVVRAVGKLSNRFELDGILHDLTVEARSVLGCKMCALYMLGEPGELELKVLVGKSGAIEYEETVRFEESSLGTAVTHNKTIEVHDIGITEEFHLSDLIFEYHLVGMLSTPIVYEGEVMGLLNAYTTEAHRFSNTEKQIFRALADMGALAIENSRLYTRIIDSEESLRSNERLTTLGLLSAEIAHEVRNPLTVIKLLVESLSLELELDGEKKRDLEVVQEKIDNLGHIVGRVLNFGKSQNQIFAKWDFNEIVRDTLQLVRYKLRRNRIEVIFREQSPVFVNCNKGQIQQVLLNLFLNADEAMPEGGEIRIEPKFLKTEKRMEVLFSDSGHGIPEELHGGIFESFLTGKASGTGLGLAIVKRILRDHRGDIEIAETSSSGTTFRFWLPV